ncbi:MAG: RNA polymerase sigma factor, partial [Thermoguttaceae bacterium]
ALRFARRLTGSADSVEDVVQEASCLVLKRWRSFRGEASFSTWMLQIVLNVDRDRRRRQSKAVTMDSEDIPSGASEPPELAEADELRDRIRSAIDDLPQRQREVALLALGEGLPVREVAEVLQTSKGHVHTCLCLARKRIAQAIGTVVPRRSRS